MKLLAIETSCDETAVTLLEFRKTTGDKNSQNKNLKFKVLKNILVSQIELHRPHGGVYPDLAKREHVKALPLLIEQAMEGLEFSELGAIAVTYGPGLSPALWVGIEAAKQIATQFNIPLYPINHMEGHIYASVLTTTSEDEYQINQFMLPAVALLISGGHTELIHITDMHQYKKVGQTLDDAAGEAFDKAARSMGLQYPGGPEISKKSSVARQKSLICKDELRLPRPMLHSGDLNFSFSGLKTAVLYALKKHTLDEDEKLAFCMEFENAITDVLIKKTSEALYLYNAKSLIVGGGVSANSHIREKLQQLADEESIDLHLPTKNLSTDNALMIAAIAVARIQHGYAPTDPASVVATPNLSLETV